MIPLAITRQLKRLHRSRLFALAAGLVLLLMCSTGARAQAAPTEVDVEAAYLFKFGGFVTWPNAAPGGSFNICVLGRDPFGVVLDRTVQGEAIGGQRLVVTRVASAHDAAQCRILFVSSSEQPNIRSIVAQLGKSPVLTVSDMPHFVDRGGMIQFVLENGRVRFEVNLASADRAGLTLSSQLLKVASAVQRGGGQE